MMLSIPLAALLIIAAPLQEPPAAAKSSALAPVLGEAVAAVVHLDLAKAEPGPFLRKVLGKQAEVEDVVKGIKALDDWIEALKKAGAKDVFLLFDLADMPGLPIAVVPLVDGADGQAIIKALSNPQPNVPIRWPAGETIRGVVVAGTPEAVARVRNAKPQPHPELLAALAAGETAPIQIAIAPGSTLRRVMEESLPTLPAELGGGPITIISKGMRWASLAMTFEPKPSLRGVTLAKDAASAKDLQKLLQKGLNFLVTSSQENPELAPLVKAPGDIKPDTTGDRVTFQVDLAKAAALVAVPVGQARESARRSQCVNNLKQIGLAMHNYHSTHNALPPAYRVSKDGKPLLSWRVHILPFIEQKELYDQFHLDEPWDSTHNKTLISKMPTTYACPSGAKALAAEGKTTYLAPRGPNSIFHGAEGVKFQDVTDGLSNTLFVIDASDQSAVIWTKPDDWKIPAEFDPKTLFGHHPGGTNAGLADGSVRFIKETVAWKVLQALTTRNGGEAINPDDL